LIVADDGSDDNETQEIGRKADTLVTLPAPPRGPARARNEGSGAARGSILAFVDADVLVHRDGLSRILDSFRDPSVIAVFGSYDDDPEDKGIVSRYRNLLHHWVHQRSAGDVESFWAGCGAIRADAFRSVGMFDAERYRRPEMEDVELGYRLRDAGHRIVLDPKILCKHLKAWSLGDMVRSDFTRRGLPWTRLLVERGMLFAPKGLSIGSGERASAGFAMLFVITALTAAATGSFLLAAATVFSTLGFFASNRRFFAWLSSRYGSGFAAAAIPLHLLYNLVAVAALLWGGVTSALSYPRAPKRYTRPR